MVCVRRSPGPVALWVVLCLVSQPVRGKEHETASDEACEASALGDQACHQANALDLADDSLFGGIPRPAPDDDGTEMIEWIRANGGYVRPGLHLGVHYMEGNDEVNRGLYTNLSAKEGEMLGSTPWHIMMKGDDHCSSLRNISREWANGPKSKFYVHLKSFRGHPRSLPWFWSKAGINAYKGVMGDLVHVEDPIKDLGQDCGYPSDTPLQEQILLSALLRLAMEMAVPLFDMENHNSGAGWNSRNNIIWGKAWEIYAKRDIAAGEEIFDSYNLCDVCGEAEDRLGTAEFFDQYGFVESLPQRWIFPDDLAFALAADPAGGDEVTFSWIWDKPDDLAWVAEEVHRLEQLGISTFAAYDGGKVPLHEWEQLRDFHRALTFALRRLLDEV